MHTIKRIFRNFRRGRSADERGATFVFTAICMVLLLWAGAMGVDVGFTVWGSRTAQAMADTGAIDLTRYLDIADNQVSQTSTQTWLDGKLAQVLKDNGSDATLTAVPGRWASGSWTVPSACQLPPISMYCNAVMVTAHQTEPQIFYGGFNTLSARSAIAANTPSAGFSIGTFLANLNTKQMAGLNAILGPIGSANLTLVGYQGVATSYVTLNQLISAQSNVLTPSNILSDSLTPKQWASILAAALDNQTLGVNCNSANAPSACEAYSVVAPGGQISVTGQQPIQLCQLVWINQTTSPPTGNSCSNTSVSPTDLQASVNVLQMLTTMAEVANGTNAINLTSALNIPGVTSAGLKLQVVQPPSVAYGPVGTKAFTAQINATLNLSVAGINLVTVTLNGATGTATLTNINCSNNAMQETDINATTTVASGAVSILGTAGNLATVSVTGVPNDGLVYSGANVPPTAATLANDSNPVQIGTTSPSLALSGWSVLSPFYLILNPVLSALSSVLGPVLSALGLTVGGADVADLSTACDAISIVK